MFFSAMMDLSWDTRSLLKSVVASVLGAPGLSLNRSAQISDDFFFSRSQILSFGTPFLSGCEISRLIGSM